MFRSAEDLERFCDEEEIEDREAEEIEVSDDVVRLMVDTADTIQDMGESWQEVFDGVVYDYLNDTVESLIEYLREAERDDFDKLAEKWEHVMGCVPNVKKWTRKKLADTEILSVRKLSAYEKAKEKARYLAEEYQHESAKWHMTYGDLCEWGDYFRNLGKRYGLSEEFRENGII